VNEEQPGPHDGTSGASDDSGAAESGPMRRSIEVEYWVIDDTGALTDPGRLVDAGPGVETEFVSPLLEIKTSPCETDGELRAELLERLGRAVDYAQAEGKGLVPLATPLSEADIADNYSERTRIQDRILGDHFEYVRHCAGTHIHVEQRPGREIDQLNTLIALDPALALVNSSPYFRAERLTCAARSELYRRMAYEHLPHQGELWPYADSRREWARRIQRRYEEFVTEAVLSGFDRETVERQFEAEGAVWTPVQLRQEFSTVEWRSPDTALPSQVLTLAAELTDIVETAASGVLRVGGDRGHVSDGEVVLPSFETVQEYVECAIRDGLAGPARRYLDRMGFDVSAYDPLTESIDSGETISEDHARELRLEYADRLVADLSRQRSIVAD
jgi:carboxylate-amine ligase